MFALENEYLNYICKSCLSISNRLVDLFNLYMSNLSDIEHTKIVYSDYEHNDFLLRLIELADAWTDPKTPEKVDSMVENYYRLNDLIRYIQSVISTSYSLRSKPVYETTRSLPQLSEIQLEDSRLTALQMDNEKHICTMSLCNVILYGDNRKDKEIPVNEGSIIITFHNTKKVEIKGEINTEISDLNTIHKYSNTETKDKLLSICFLILVGYKCCLVQIICDQINVKVTDYRLPDKTHDYYKLPKIFN